VTGVQTCALPILYIGRGRMVHAPQSGRNVEVVRLATTNYGPRLIGARRVAS